MNKLSIGVILLMSIGFFSCETDIDVNAEPSDITVVYGLIDPVDTVHYFKINKAFIGEGSALDLAANSSNYTYTDDELDVRIDGNGTSYPLIRVTNEIVKEDGVFDSSTNVLYKFKATINRDASYTLKIKNKKTAKEITAETKIVKKSSVSNPLINGAFDVWNGSVSSGNYLSETVTVSAGDNVGRAQVFVVFNYIEHYTTGAPVEKSVVLNLGEKTTADSPNNELGFLMKGQSFVDNIKAKVPAPSTVANFSHRELANVSIEVLSAGTELSTYMEAESPSVTVNQDKPSYTNIINGIGIFSSRSQFLWVSTRDASNGNLNLNTDTRRFLSSIDLGFCFGTPGSTSFACP